MDRLLLRALRVFLLILSPLMLLYAYKQIDQPQQLASQQHQHQHQPQQAQATQPQTQSPMEQGSRAGEQRIVLLSDSHGLHLQPALAVPAGDLLVCAGDIELRGSRDWQNFLNFLKPLPHATKVVSFGNMDVWTEGLGSDAPEWHEAAAQGVHVVRDGVQEVGGLRVFASPWTPKFYGAYQLDNAQAAKDHWARVLPPNTEVDILVTHGPPHGFGDLTRNRHVGDRALLEAVQALHNPPKLWVCGHVHDGRGQHMVPHPKGPILLVNAAVAHLKNGRPEIQPFVITLRVRPGWRWGQRQSSTPQLQGRSGRRLSPMLWYNSGHSPSGDTSPVYPAGTY